MRHKLKRLNGSRLTFKGEYVRTGIKNGFKGTEETVLIKDIVHDNEPVCDHVWFNKTKGFRQLNLQSGDTVEFDARVEDYQKGYRGWDIEKQISRPLRWDYHLTRPTKVKKIVMCRPDAVTGHLIWDFKKGV